MVCRPAECAGAISAAPSSLNRPVRDDRIAAEKPFLHGDVHTVARERQAGFVLGERAKQKLLDDECVFAFPVTSTERLINT